MFDIIMGLIVLTVIASVIRKVVRKFSAMKSTIASLEMESYLNRVDALGNSIVAKGLKADLRERDARIEALESDVVDGMARIAKLHQLLGEKVEQVAELSDSATHLLETLEIVVSQVELLSRRSNN